MNRQTLKINLTKKPFFPALAALIISIILIGTSNAYAYTKFPHMNKSTTPEVNTYRTYFETAEEQELTISYLKAGSSKKPTIVLLYDNSSSSNLYGNLIPMLAKSYYVITPNYSDFINISTLDSEAKYNSHENLSFTLKQFLDHIGETKYTLYVAGKNAPVGFRLAAKYPERIEGLIVQNANSDEKNLDTLDMHLFRSGHFVLEENSHKIGRLVNNFMRPNYKSKNKVNSSPIRRLKK